MGQLKKLKKVLFIALLSIFSTHSFADPNEKASLHRDKLL